MNNHSITDEKIISASENEIVLEVKIPSSSDFFDGHFPEYKIFPAVGQFEVITRFAEKYFSIPEFVSSIKRMKFLSPIIPETVVMLKLKKSENSVSFVMSKKEDETMCCSGSFDFA